MAIFTQVAEEELPVITIIIIHTIILEGEGEEDLWAEEQCKRGDQSAAKKVLSAFMTDTVERRIEDAELEVAAS